MEWAFPIIVASIPRKRFPVSLLQFMLLVLFAIVISAPSRAADQVQGGKATVRAYKAFPSYHVPPGEDEIPNDRYGDDVRLGLKIFTETYKYARRYTGNGMSCSNCHLNRGRKAHSAPLWAVFAMYPAYKAKNDQNNTPALQCSPPSPRGGARTATKSTFTYHAAVL